jgi:hypothetical protein
MEWIWAGQIASRMKQALLAGDWATIALLLPQIAAKLNKVQVSPNHRLGSPWIGSWNVLKKE